MTFNHAHLHPYKTPLQSSDLKRNGLWATDNETAKGWTHVVDLTLFCSATPDTPPSIHLLQRLGLFVAGSYARCLTQCRSTCSSPLPSAGLGFIR